MVKYKAALVLTGIALTVAFVLRPEIVSGRQPPVLQSVAVAQATGPAVADVSKMPLVSVTIVQIKPELANEWLEFQKNETIPTLKKGGVTQRNAFATAIGSFQEGPVAGKIQFGSAWWFLDQKEGIEWHLNALSNTGLLPRFVGMLADSRSFMSFPRHEYFRRVFCNLLGREVENGELPNDEALLGAMVQNVCFRNAEQYLGLGFGATSKVIGAPAGAASADSG